MKQKKKMHADELGVSVSLVRKLIATQFPRWANLPIKSIPSAGTDNALFRLGRDMVVRLPRIHWAVNDVLKEHEFLPKLAPLLPLDIPVPICKGAPAEGYPWHWSVYQWLEGQNPIIGQLSNPYRLAAELANFIDTLHRVDLSGGPTSSRGVPLSMRDEPTRTAIHELDGLIDTDAVTKVWDMVLKTPKWTGSAVWVHGDLSPGNLLLVNGQLNAVIDFGCLGIGDPACDIIVAWNLLPSETRDVFRNALKVDSATWARGRGWALSIALIQLPYYRNTNPVLAANARHVIEEILREINR